ncbi:MAG: hypothetical protein M3R17_14995 [Bacteroidota bacterium]|nr:hypothetical protein [Bacteroidota bacterium]
MHVKSANTADAEKPSRAIAHTLSSKKKVKHKVTSDSRALTSVQEFPDYITTNAPAGQLKSIGSNLNVKPVQLMDAGAEEEDDWAHFPAVIVPAVPAVLMVGMGEFRRSDQTMRTEGLYNCMGIAAFHQASGFASFTHYDTSAAFNHEVLDGEEELDDFDNPVTHAVASAERLGVLRAALLASLQQADGVTFYISLGVVWQPARNAEDPRMMNELIAALNAVFAPQQLDTTGRLTAQWSPATQTIT